MVLRAVPFFGALAGLVAVSLSFGKTPKSPQEAITTLATGHGEDLEAAIALLKAQKDLFKRYSGALKAVLDKRPDDSELARRFLEVVRDRDGEGCKLVASLIDPGHPALVDEVLTRLELMPSCEEMRTAVAGILGWAEDPESSPAAAQLVDRVIEIVKLKRLGEVPEKACRFVLSGATGRRLEMIRAISEALPPWGSSCLIRAYHEEASAPKEDASVREALLRTISTVYPSEAMATLVYALEIPQDFDTACKLLRQNPTEGLKGLIFAVRTAQNPGQGLRRCINEFGEIAASSVVSLLDHPSPSVRDLAIDFLKQHHSEAAFKDLVSRYEGKGGAIPKTTLLEVIGLYPVEKMRPILEEALLEDDEAMRMKALEVIETSASPAFSASVLEVAERDKSEALRLRALEVAWHIGAEGLGPLALRMVQYEKPSVAAMAARVLGFVGDQEAIKVLFEVLPQAEEEVAGAAKMALWLLTYQDPEKGSKKFLRGLEIKTPQGGKVVEFGKGRGAVFGTKGPLVVALPGGPGMDFRYLYPMLEDLAEDAVVALLEGENGIVAPTALSGLLEASGRKKAVLFSHGLGGTLALWLATLEPERVAGVVVISAPLPKNLETWDQALLARLSEPFRSVADGLFADQAKFSREVLNRAMTRVLAPALSSDPKRPSKVLGVTWDLLAYGQAHSVLSRPEVRFSPAEFGGEVLFLLPLDLLPEDLKAQYSTVASEGGEKVRIEDVSDCGFIPSVECPSKVRKLVLKFASRLLKE